jgi:hypothetical protein
MDPRRLTEEGSDFASELLRSGLSDNIPAASARTIMAGLGVASPVAAAGAAGAATTAGSLLTVKSALLVASLGVGGAAALFGGQALFADGGQLSAPSVSRVEAPAPALVAAPVIEESEPVVAPETAADDAPTPNSVAPPRAVSSKADTLALELEAIDQARSALAGGDHALASRLLDRYAARFPRAHLGAEATVLRIQTLAARGDSRAAARLGKSFLAKNPNGPYARRVRSLVGGSSPAPSAVEASPHKR